MKELIFRSITSIILLITFYFSYVFDELFYLIILIVFIISFIEFNNLINKIYLKEAFKHLLKFSGAIYLIFISYLLIVNLSELKNLIFYFISICIATDIGGLVFGKTFKGKKLTKISPNKTYSGFYGSFIFSFFIMMLFYKYLNLDFTTILILTFSICLLSQIGDIFFSFLKRKAKVKDTGKILPGHGGILDRVDGIIISLPINILFYTISL